MAVLKGSVSSGEQGIPPIRVENLWKSFGSQNVLKGLSFAVYPGETFVVIGGSGQGKSVLLKHIMRLMKADRGEIYVEGNPIMALEQKELYALRRKMGMVFQESALFDSMTVLDNVAFALRMHTSLPEKDIVSQALEKLSKVGLRDVEKKFPSQISGGMKKRVAIARAIALAPEILLYDEPTTGLDPVLSSAIDELILKMQSDLAVTSIVITHDMKSALKIANRVLFLFQGTIRFLGTPQDLTISDDPVLSQFVKGETQGPIGTL
ncbi:MAG: ABC transporter ATP-binding protein [Nitrospirae bacterium]|jgi:phospholipid/cholesterol/gamma-HCH transport system ATP-binding protein|nr:ABC transporter ATP-binding protein [Nitrospirota bacterium]